jgi:hypothetical protein
MLDHHHHENPDLDRLESSPAFNDHVLSACHFLDMVAAEVAVITCFN